MEIGKRVMIPEPTGQLGEGSWCFFATARQQGYLEMRKVGVYPDALAYSVVLAFLESCAYFPDQEKVQVIITAVLGEGVATYPLENLESVKVSERLESPSFRDQFVQQCGWFFRRFQISEIVDESFSNIQRLSELLELSVDLACDEVRKWSIGYNTAQKIMIGVMNNTCFVLYSSLTKESFVTLPCGHLQLRFSLMQLLQQSVGHYTLTASDQLQLQVCNDCEATYTCELFDFAQALANGVYPFTVTPQLHPMNPHVLVCYCCNREIKLDDLSMFCSCSNTVCVNCVIVQRTKPGSLHCPACSIIIEETAFLEQFATSRKNLCNKLPSFWVTVKQSFSTGLKKKCCYICSNEYQILEFDNHANCWICPNCIRSELAKNSMVCSHCNQKFDDTRESFQRMKDSVSGGEERKVQAHHQPPGAAKTKKPGPKIAEKPNQQELLFSPSASCSQCSVNISDPEPFPLQDHTCITCRNCLKQNAQSGKCGSCNNLYSARDAKALKELTAQEANIGTCSRCKTCCSLSDIHFCKESKKKCRNCCIKDVIAQFTSTHDKCKECENDFCRDMRIDVNEKVHMCSACNTQKSLLEIAHSCVAQVLCCRDCVKFNKTNVTQCKTCQEIFRDKYYDKAWRLPR